MKKKTLIPLCAKGGLALALGILAGGNVYARHLAPEDALSMLSGGQLKVAPNQTVGPLKLAYTKSTETELATVYVFGREGGQGFYLLAADDAVGDIVLGYSHEGSFSADNIAPGMQWLLDAYSQYVSSCAEGLEQPVQAYAPAAWTAVAPLLTTQWNQTAPYNAMCPMVFGERAISGCVSVATAQVMKKHQWPVKGNGSMTYRFNLNGQNFEYTSNFSQHVYDWNNMLDSYNGSYNQTQVNAVAQLIYDCGVTGQTIYIGPSFVGGSSGSMAKAAGGMIQYFDYDKSMHYMRRSWYTDDQWLTEMYSQLQLGQPVLYSGQGGQEGHAFVLDGYDGSGYFHFNWGWGGLNDGFFSLDAIQYDRDQEAIVNVKKNTGSALTTEFAVVGNVVTDRTEYRPRGEYIYFSSEPNGGYYSFTLAEVTAEIGMKLSTTGNVVRCSNPTKFGILQGMGRMGVPTSNIPNGEYDLYPVYRVNGGEWIPMKYDLKATSGRLHVVNDGNKIAVTTVDIPDGITDIEAGNVTVKAVGGSIHVDSPYDTPVKVYDISGMLRYSGTDRIIPVTPGRLYIVVVAGKAYKVKA